MLEHPWTELQVLIKEKWLTQKAFSSILWKKVSEVNELLKWKRNITIQRDYLLHQTLWTPIKYWILKQIDYDYSLIDIDESSLSTPQSLRDSSPNREQNSDDDFTPLWGGDGEARGGWLQHTESFWTQWRIQENAEQVDSSSQAPQNDEGDINNNPGSISMTDQDWNREQNENKIEPGLNWVKDTQETPIQEPNPKDDEDFKKRARIFKSF